MNSHYYSAKPSSSGKTTIIKTFQFGQLLTFKSKSGIFGWQKVDKGSKLLLNNLILPSKGTILDLGCGYGFIGIALAKAFPNLEVILTDINELAVTLTNENCLLNNVTENTKVFQGYLFEPLHSYTFNSVITNPPLMAGKKILQQIVSQAKNVLVDGGTLQLVVPKKKGLISIQKMLIETYGVYEVIAKGSGFWVLKAEKS